MEDMAVINLFVILAIGGVCVHTMVSLKNIKKELEALHAFQQRVGQEAKRS